MKRILVFKQDKELKIGNEEILSSIPQRILEMSCW